jgi:hypothetical protein
LFTTAIIAIVNEFESTFRPRVSRGCGWHG